MALLTPLAGSAPFLDGWSAESRYAANMLISDAETRFNAWAAEVDALFRAAGKP